MTTTAPSPLPRLTGDGEVCVAVQTELMMDYRMVSPFADASKTLAAAAFADQPGRVLHHYQLGRGGDGNARFRVGHRVGGDRSAVPRSAYGTVIDIAAYQDWYAATVVWACTSSGVYYASSQQAWAWTQHELGLPAGSVIGGVRGAELRLREPAVRRRRRGRAAQLHAAAVAALLPAKRPGCLQQPDHLPGDLPRLVGWPGSAPRSARTAARRVRLRAWLRRVQPAGRGSCAPATNPESTPLFLAGTYPVLATALNSSGALEAFVIDADDSNSLNYLSPTGASPSLRSRSRSRLATTASRSPASDRVGRGGHRSQRRHPRDRQHDERELCCTSWPARARRPAGASRRRS